MQKTKRALSARIFSVLILICLCLSFAACSAGDGGTENIADGISVTVDIVSQQGDSLLSKTIEVEKDSTAAAAMKKACQAEKFAYHEKSGLYDGFGGIESTETDGWLFYVNGEMPSIGANEYKLKAGDTVSFRYQNYDEAFAQ